MMTPRILLLSLTIGLLTPALAGRRRADPPPVDKEQLTQNADDAFQELDGRFTLRFSDALTGNPVEGATVRIDGQRGTTNGEGAVTFNKPDNFPI